MTGANNISVLDYCFAGYNIQQITFRNFHPEKFYYASINQYRTNCCYFLQKNSKSLHIVVGNETGYKFLHNIIESSHNFDDATLTLNSSVDTQEA